MSAQTGAKAPRGTILTLLRLIVAFVVLALLWFVYGWLGALIDQLLARLGLALVPQAGAFIAVVLTGLIVLILLWSDQGALGAGGGFTLRRYWFRPDRCTSPNAIALTGPYPRWAGWLTPFSQDVAALAPTSSLAGHHALVQTLLNSTLNPSDIPALEALIPKDGGDLSLERLVRALQTLKRGHKLTPAVLRELGEILQACEPYPPQAGAAPADKPKTHKTAVDDQTGEAYELVPEHPGDITVANFSVVYLVVAMVFFFWLAFDTWVGQYTLARLLRYPDLTHLMGPGFRLAAFAFIGGGLGGIVNGIRSILSWHSERGAFSRRFIWKYITAPFQGAALALFAYALIRGGVAAVNGDTAQGAINGGQLLAVFSIGVLAGYGSQKVFVWLDAQVNRIFQVEPSAKVKVPTLMGKTQAEAVELLSAAGLALGVVTTQPQSDATLNGKVVSQSPQAQAAVTTSAAIDITVAGAGVPAPASAAASITPAKPPFNV